VSANESKQSFEDYYDAQWLKKHEYFRFHKTRFLHSFEILNPFVEQKSTVADFVQPGDGPGPLAGFFEIEKNAVLVLITSDLRGHLDVADSSCDMVLCTETIEHIKDKESTAINDLERFNYSGVDSMLSETARILTDTGKLFITTPNSSSFTNLYKWLMGELPYMDPNHVREYTVDLLNETCRRNGLVPIAIELRNSWGNVPENLIVEFEHILTSCSVKRNVSRGENIYAVYSKR